MNRNPSMYAASVGPSVTSTPSLSKYLAHDPYKWSSNKTIYPPSPRLTQEQRALFRGPLMASMKGKRVVALMIQATTVLVYPLRNSTHEVQAMLCTQSSLIPTTRLKETQGCYT